ncbi:hypothetical protein F4777DRAFT_580306 [Nemania sp. FL0916]|nr:hypothetical protein F4777DRAFT_580306 [Nemania sp. FL0916]
MPGHGVHTDQTDDEQTRGRGSPTLVASTRPPLSDGAYQERVAYLDHVRLFEAVGFKHQASMSIFHYWFTILQDAPAGGPYDLLGAALAAIAELSEPKGWPSYGDNHEVSAFAWQRTFAQVLNYEALEAVREAGAYLAPDFAKAKLLVNRLIQQRWEQLVRFGKAFSQFFYPAAPTDTMSLC